MVNTEIKNAATIILLRGNKKDSKVLMGQRGQNASFMPNKFVFPGGAVDSSDSEIVFSNGLDELLHSKLRIKSKNCLESAIVAAGIRELWEETGLILGSFSEKASTGPSESWSKFFNSGFQPDAKNMDLVFRAITPPGRTKRFDARFFLVNAENIRGDLDDFSNASGELNHLQWIGLNAAEKLDLPIITQIVLKEVKSIVEGGNPPGFPFYYHEAGVSNFERLGLNEKF